MSIARTILEKIGFINNGQPAINDTNLNQLQTNVQNALDSMKTNVENAIQGLYPVGSIYLSVVPTNPVTLFGFGIWEAWGSGRVPVGVDTTQTEFETVEKTGGEKTHTLTVDEIPSHSHDIKVKQNAGSFSDGYPTGGNTYDYVESNAPILATGGNQPHNNLQPYITCYMWKRTA